MYTKILVATDGSKLSNKAITEAAQLAGLAGAKLLLLYVQQPYDAPRAEETAPGGLGVMRRLQEARAAAAEALLHAASSCGRTSLSKMTSPRGPGPPGSKSMCSVTSVFVLGLSVRRL